MKTNTDNKRAEADFSQSVKRETKTDEPTWFLIQETIKPTRGIIGGPLSGMKSVEVQPADLVKVSNFVSLFNLVERLAELGADGETLMVWKLTSRKLQGLWTRLGFDGIIPNDWVLKGNRFSLLTSHEKRAKEYDLWNSWLETK